MKLDTMLVRDILKAVSDSKEDNPLLNIKEVCGFPDHVIIDSEDRLLLETAEAHLRLMDEAGVVESSPFHSMPPGGWHHSRPNEKGPRVPYEYFVRLTWRGHVFMSTWRYKFLQKVPTWLYKLFFRWIVDRYLVSIITDSAPNDVISWGEK